MGGDLSDPVSLSQAKVGVTSVCSVHHHWDHRVGMTGERQQARHLSQAARGAGVKHFVHSTMARASSVEGVEHFQSKADVEADLQALGMPLTLLGTVSFVKHLLDPKVGGAMTFPVLSASVPADTPVHLKAAQDLGELMWTGLRDPQRFIGQRIDVAGDVLTVPQMKAPYRRASGRTPKSNRVPAWLLRRLNPEFAAQLRWPNEVGWMHGPAHPRKLYPDLTTSQAFVRRHALHTL